ncbi:MAG: ABC transporter ATP-binding protein [bacterium]
MKPLEIQELTVHYLTARGSVKALEKVFLELRSGEALGLVGESGCGKTTVAMAILGLLAPNAKILGGRILLEGRDLFSLDPETMRALRWKKVAMVFQAAMNALNPVHRVGEQILEAIRIHDGQITEQEALKRLEELCAMVGLDPARMKDYPHQFSGGMRQRAVIAMALSCHPSILIADEPTTALDVMVADQILGQLRRLQVDMGLSILYISHDISVIARSCDRMGVMYAGQIVEFGPTDEVLERPLHPYTQGLMRSYPQIQGPRKRLEPIPGEPPNLLDPPQGCRFCPRCPENGEICAPERPQWTEYRKDHFALCHRIRI